MAAEAVGGPRGKTRKHTLVRPCNKRRDATTREWTGMSDCLRTFLEAPVACRDGMQSPGGGSSGVQDDKEKERR